MTDKIYLQNPYLREISARIVDKKYIDNKFYIKLNRTIFYPNMSGGQPMDKGTINGIEVLDTYEEGEDIIHVVKENIQDKNVQLNIDWDTRFDHMQQHTGQHLLSSVFYNLYNAETVGFHLGREYVYIDITLPELTDEDIKRVEKFSNKIIFSNFNIKTYYIDKNNISKIPLRKQPSVTTNIRIVEIDGMDYSPCCGTHHRSTGEIGLIKIRKWEKYKGNTRVEFVCGNRALQDYSWKNTCINNISALLSSKDTDTYDKVKIVFEHTEELEKENRNLQEELSKYKAKELLNDSMTLNNIQIIKKKFQNTNIKEVSFMSSYLINNIDDLILILGVENAEKSQFILSRSNNLKINISNIFKEISKKLGVKGGGSIQTVQGGCSNTDLDLFINNAYEYITKEI